jgi:hypothetical protein
VALDPVRLAAICDDVLHGAPQLLEGCFGGIVFEDASLCLDDLGQCPEGHPLPVRERPTLAPVDELRILVDRRRELEDEPALPDPRDADERHQLGGALSTDARQRIEKNVELLLAPHEGNTSAQAEVDPVASAGLQHLPHLDGVGLAFGRDGCGLAILDRPFGRAIRRFADEDAVDRRGGLEPCGRVHDVS